MSNRNEDCTCGAWNASECACDADWTPQELIDARNEITALREEIMLLRNELAQAKIYTPARRASPFPAPVAVGECNSAYWFGETDEEFAASGKPYSEVTE